MKTKGLERIISSFLGLLLVISAVMSPIPAAAQTGTVTASATPSNTSPNVGQQVSVPIHINMSGVNAPDNNLGSFSSTLSWNPAILSYSSNSGLATGFTGSINTTSVSSGLLTFNGANASGAGGDVVVITFTFDVVLGGTTALDLNFSAMAAASTFVSLLSILSVTDGSLTAVGTTYNLTVSANPSAGGTTTPSVGSHPYNAGTVVNVSATPATNYAFSSWSGACTGSGICQVTMNANKSVTANFTTAPTPATFTGEELLGRPTDGSVSVKVVPDEAISLFYEYGTSPGTYTGSTSTTTAVAGQPKLVVIDELNPSTKYYYRMEYSKDGGTTWIPRDEHSFWTERAKGSTFTFDITTDSHVNILLGSATTWTNTLNDVADDQPDFMIDLGDTFDMRSKEEGDVSGAEDAYEFQLQFFNIVSHSAPIFLAPGNHEQQEAWHLDGTANSLSVIGTNAQKKYFLNPVPDGSFYTGDESTYTHLSGDQHKEDYYSWTWGDALFVVINPYWYTETKPYISDLGGGEDDWTGSGDAWDWTLGKTQFDWLKATLEGSNAKYKFMFSHQMVSDASLPGQEDYGHAGANYANLVEWGGYNENGSTYGWPTERSGWGEDPIHALMVENGVSAFFHGHDHQYAYEKRDDVVYQAVPSAGFSGNGFSMYTTGDGYTIQALPSSGHLRVTVDPTETTVEYIQTSETSSEYTYTIAPNEVNAPPEFNESDPQSVTMSVNGDPIPFALTLSAEDPEDDPITWSISSQASHGTASVSGTGTSKAISYTPVTDFEGTDSFQVQISDGIGGIDTLTVNVYITTSVIPTLPSSFYGQIHFMSDDGGPITGDTIEAYLDDSIELAESALISWDDDVSSLVYAINVPAFPDGGLADTVTFKINGRIVAVADWISGSNVGLNIHPPKTIISGGPYLALLSEASVSILGVVSDWGNDIDTRAWDLDNDGLYNDATVLNPTFAFSNPGSYPIKLKAVDSHGGEGYAESFVIVVEFVGLTGQVYDGSGKSITVNGVSAPYTYNVLYDGEVDLPINAGSYEVVVQIKLGETVVGSLQSVMVIGKATAVVTLQDLSHYYDGLPKEARATTDPTELSVTITYDGSITPPSEPGSYSVVATVVDDNYTGTTNGTMTIIELKHAIDLVEGWNLISFNLTPEDTSVENVLATVEGNYDLVYAWDASGGHNGSGNWIKYDPNAPIGNTLENLYVNQGFWIHMTAADLLEVYGTFDESTTINLLDDVGGWNLMGYPSASSELLPDALDSIDGVYTLVYANHAADTADLWKMFDPSAPGYVNDLLELAPGWGYWIFVNSDAELEVTY